MHPVVFSKKESVLIALVASPIIVISLLTVTAMYAFDFVKDKIKK